MARVAANGGTSNDGNATASRAVVGTPPPRRKAQAKDRTGRRRRASFSHGSQMRMEQPWASRDTMTLWLTRINCWWQ